MKTGSLETLFEEMQTDYEMVLKGIDERTLNKIVDLKIKVEKRPDLIVLKFDEQVKSRVIEFVTNSGGDIISLHPLRKSLEVIFIEEAERDTNLEN